jgi:GrpE
MGGWAPPSQSRDMTFPGSWDLTRTSVIAVLAGLLGLAAGYWLAARLCEGAREAHSGPIQGRLSQTPIDAATSDADAARGLRRAMGAAPERGPLASERDRLISLCIDLRDRLGAGGLGNRIGQELASVGVTTVDPAGGAFDAKAQVAVGVEVTADRILDGTIAQVEELGYMDRDRVLRLPSVIVWRLRRP